MISQPEQQPDLFTPRPAGNGGGETPASWLEDLLLREKAWLTAAEILKRLGKQPTDDLKRWLRDEASRAKFVLSGPGSPGYKHIAHCTPEEISHYRNALLKQGKEMIQRSLKIARSAHQIFG